MAEITLLPGRSINAGSANIAYPAGDILNVKGFYEQDSHVMPDLVDVRTDEINEGIENIWYEYVPADLDMSKPMPLVLTFHGGGQSGWGQCYATSWAMMAEKYGFVAIFPTASNGRGWNGDPEGPDFKMVDYMINRAKKLYNIDLGRIYIQGMSSGNMMVTALSKNCPTRFAGAGMSAGPSTTDLFVDPNTDLSGYSTIPVYQSRGERDTMCPPSVEGMNRYILNKVDRDFWLTVGGCDLMPAAIKIVGRDNFFIYKGETTDLVYRDVKYRGHGQTIDDAEQMWRQFFSAYSRDEKGNLIKGEPIDKLESDKAVILADGCKKVYVDSKLVELDNACYELLQYMDVDEGMIARMPELADKANVPSYGPFLYAPVEVFAKAFGCDIEYTHEGRRAVVTSSCGKVQLQFAEGNVGCTLNGVLKNLERQAEYKNGVLYVPMKGVAEMLGKVVAFYKGVMYITDHSADITNDFAGMLKEYMA